MCGPGGPGWGRHDRMQRGSCSQLSGVTRHPCPPPGTQCLKVLIRFLWGAAGSLGSTASQSPSLTGKSKRARAWASVGKVSWPGTKEQQRKCSHPHKPGPASSSGPVLPGLLMGMLRMDEGKARASSPHRHFLWKDVSANPLLAVPASLSSVRQ